MQCLPSALLGKQYIRGFLLFTLVFYITTWQGFFLVSFREGAEEEIKIRRILGSMGIN